MSELTEALQNKVQEMQWDAIARPESINHRGQTPISIVYQDMQTDEFDMDTSEDRTEWDTIADAALSAHSWKRVTPWEDDPKLINYVHCKVTHGGAIV